MRFGSLKQLVEHRRRFVDLGAERVEQIEKPSSFGISRKGVAPTGVMVSPLFESDWTRQRIAAIFAAPFNHESYDTT